VHRTHSNEVSRRDALRLVAAAGVCTAIGPHTAAADDALALTPILRKIPSTGEQVPVIGIGGNGYDVSEPKDIAVRREVLQAMPELGGRIIDTARGYGRSEEVIGSLLAELGSRERFFIATKPLSAPQADAVITRDLVEESFRKLRTDRIDLLQVHSLLRLDELIPLFMEYKRAGRVRYIGVTTSVERQHAQMLEAMRRHPIDFIQVNYSIENRAVEQHILPLALEKGIAVLNNVPFGGRSGSLLARAAGKPLPKWAAEFDVTSWPQFLLKYCVSHPGITAVIPGTTKLSHLRDNQAGGRGRLPDAALRRRMEQLWADL